MDCGEGVIGLNTGLVPSIDELRDGRLPLLSHFHVTAFLSYFSGFRGHAFDPASIPVLARQTCAFTVPVQMDRLGGCAHSPFGEDARRFLASVNQLTVYLNGTGGGTTDHHTITFNASEVSRCIIVPALDTCAIPSGLPLPKSSPEFAASLDYHVLMCALNFTMPKDMLFGTYHVTLVASNASGFSVAQTRGAYQIGSDANDVVGVTVAEQIIQGDLMMPTQAADFYGASRLAVARTGAAAAGPPAAVLLVTSGAYFSQADFDVMMAATNVQNYTEAPLRAGQLPTAQFVSQPRMDTAALAHSSPLANLTADPQLKSPVALRNALERDFQNLRSGNATPVLNDASHPETELTLDVQFIGAISRAEAIQAFSTGYFFAEVAALLPPIPAQLFLFLGSLYAALYSETPPGVISMSFGFPMDPGGNNTSSGNFDLWEIMFVALGAAGVSVIAGSGDGGASGANPKENLYSYNASSRTWTQPVSCSRGAFWPAASPYVTSVGGTQLAQASDDSDSSTTWPPWQESRGSSGTRVVEVAQSATTAGGITSGGGFSNYAVSPTYQKSAVAAYLASLAVQIDQRSANHPEYGPFFPSSTFPASMTDLAGLRGYPDVSAIGHFCTIIKNGTVVPVDGTSCSAPLFAGLISLLNAELAERGRPALGFLNPTLYAAPAFVFSDVVRGDNSGLHSASGATCTNGYPATTAWDPVTGRGTSYVQWFGGAHLIISGWQQADRLT